MRTTFIVTITTDDEATVENVERFVMVELEHSARSHDCLDRYDIEWAEVSDVALAE